MYTQNLCSIVPTQADYATVKSKFSTLKDTNVSGTMTRQIQRMLDNIDTLSGSGSAEKLLDGAGVKDSDIANLSPDERARLSEKVTNRYMSAIKEAAGDTGGSFADVYGNCKDAAAASGSSVSPRAATPPKAASAGAGTAASPADGSSAAVDPQGPGPAAALVDLLVRSMGLGMHRKHADAAVKDPGAGSSSAVSAGTKAP